MARTTTEQRKVVDHKSGHALVSAVAGSGKSTTLIERIMALLAHGVEPERILVLMFNKSARDDFTSRLVRRAQGIKVPEVFTFHGFGNRLCKALVTSGTLDNATLVTESYRSIRFGREVLEALNEGLSDVDQLDLSSEVVIEFLEIMDLLKGAMFDGITAPKELPPIDARYLKAFAIFEAKRTNEGLRFFADLIYDPVCAALARNDLAAKIGNRYDHLIVDEFQDINEAQMAMMRIVAGRRAQVLAVGDDDQTIYGWRGARADYMTHLFELEFPGATRYAISRTFRFGHGLSLLANHAITNNKNRTDKLCVSAAPHQTAVGVRMHTAGCGAPVIEEIERWRTNGGTLSDIAILIRQYANSIPVEIALHQAGIPYRIVGAPPFVDRAEVIALRGYLQLACGGFAGITNTAHIHSSIAAMLSVPTLYLRRDQIEGLADEAVVLPARALEVISDTLRREQGIKPFSRDRREEAMENWRWCAQQAPSMPAARFLGDLIRRTKLFDFIAKNNPRSDVAAEKIRMVHQITDLAYAGRHTVQSFLALLDELSNSFADGDADSDRVLLTSCHRAKGMEWPMVILPDLADGLFPHCTIDSTDADIEDERRLFYVALTRALKDLVLIAPLDRQLLLWSKERRPGHPQVAQIKASRFLFEANIELSVLAGDAIACGRAQDDGRHSVVTRRYEAALTAE